MRAHAAGSWSSVPVTLRVFGVLGSLAVLGLIVLSVGFSNYTTGHRSGARTARTQVWIFSMGINHYYENHGRLPSTLHVLAEEDLLTGETYMESIPEDPWGNPYQYAALSDTEYRILSRGEDGREGTADDVVWPREE